MQDTRRLKAIDGFYRSYALMPGVNPTGAAVVFVHGFAGSPTGTWSDFHGLTREYARDYPWWKEATLFFYSYESTRKPIHFNATRLRMFLDAILIPAVEKVDNARLAKRKRAVQGERNYSKLLLVGHSEGAVLIRRMILNKMEALEKKGREKNFDGADLVKWIDKHAARDLILESHVLLFAPACAGTNFSGALGFAHGVSRFFSAIASSYLVRNELLKGSPILAGLQSGTESVFRAHPKIRALPAKILFGTEDQVVYTDKYACDEIVEPYAEGHDHFSVCKPSYIYKRPLEFVKP
jgi:pimeloyl-ACP methyl ester carboxylesterase